MNSEGKSRESKLTSHGTKARISPVVSQLFRAIGSEMTEMICLKVPDSKTGAMETRLVSKAEAMVRDLFEQAMPAAIGEETDCKHQLACRKIILDFTIDKNVKEQAGETAADKVSDLNKDRLNAMAKGDKVEWKASGEPQKWDDIENVRKEKAKSKKSKCPRVPVCIEKRKEPDV